jgi:hypothetical protein
MANKNIKAGEAIHSGDGGYGIGTRENYNEFVKIRNQSLTITKPQQRTWVGLTDEEVADIERNSITRRQAIRAIEAKLKEKNT